MNDKSNKLLGHVLAFITITVWGSTFIATKYLLDVFTPIQIMTFRFIIAYIILLIMNHRFEKFNIKQEVSFILLALAGCSIYFLMENKALTMTSASNVSIIVASAPILTAVLAHIFTKNEKMNLNIVLGFIIAFAGVGLVVFNGAFILKLNPVGDLLSLSSAMSWAIYSVLLKKSLSKYKSTYIARKTMFYGLLTSLPFVFMEGAPIDFAALINSKYLISLLFLGIIGSALCYVIWNNVSRSIGTVMANNYIYGIPFVTLVTAGLMLGEAITPVGIVGALLIICGVAVSSRQKRLFEKNKLAIESLGENEA